MKLKRIFTIVLMCVMSAAMAVAQVHVEAKLDSMVILIGQQTRYWIERENVLRQTFAKSNVDWVSVATNDDYVKAMMLLFAQRS